MKLLVNFDENEYKALRMFKNSGVEIESQSLRAIADGAPFDDEAAVIKKLFNADKIIADGVEYIELNISEEDKDYISKVIELEWYKKAIEDINAELEALINYEPKNRLEEERQYGIILASHIFNKHINGIRKETT